MITISKNANKNYLAKVILVENLRKHSNADRLQILDVDFQTVVTGLDTKNGDIFVYFPIECSINKDFLSYTNSFRNKELNLDSKKEGFFDDNGRVKALRLRGEKSMGYIVPFDTIIEWSGLDRSLKSSFIGKEFDTINGKLLLKKYEVKIKKEQGKVKEGKKPKVSRIIDGQVRLHTDTANLRKNAHKISPDDIISITYKTHGTSWWVANVLNRRFLTRWQKVLRFFGADIKDTDYDVIYGSRRVVKNDELKDPKAKNHYYGYDVWKDVMERVGDKIPKGYTLYGELLGYDKNGKYIQNKFDYGCKPKESKVEVYRITNTNSDGIVTELTYPQIAEFCEKVGLTPSHLIYYGKAKGIKFPTAGYLNPNNHWNESFVKALEEDFNEKDCFMCNNKVPEEGIVVRKESLLNCESYKLKSFSFLEFETKQLDKGEEILN